MVLSIRSRKGELSFIAEFHILLDNYEMFNRKLLVITRYGKMDTGAGANICLEGDRSRPYAARVLVKSLT